MATEESIPVWEKPYLTLHEAAAYFNIGIGRLRDMSNEDDCDFIVWVGSKKLFKRRKLESFIDTQYSI